ncbi:MAG: hypothetical protein V4461_13115 [Pseudomonadota bacterium]
MTKYFLIFAFFLFNEPAHADEIKKYIKLTCIPEIGFMEITGVFTYKEVSNAVRTKYNLVEYQNAKCSFSGAEYGVELKEINQHMVDGKTVGPCSADDIYDFYFLVNGERRFKINGYFSRCSGPEFPSIVTFQGNQISYCEGFESVPMGFPRRICNTVNIPKKQILEN